MRDKEEEHQQGESWILRKEVWRELIGVADSKWEPHFVRQFGSALSIFRSLVEKPNDVCDDSKHLSSPSHTLDTLALDLTWMNTICCLTL